MLAIAMTLNLVGHHFIEGTFNMFYISPYYPCPLVILDNIYAAQPYAVFLIIYAVGFVVCAFIMFLIQFGILKLCQAIYGNTRK